MNIPSSIPNVCFTGHRSLTDTETKTTVLRLRQIVRHLAQNYGTKNFYAGGALGFDTLAAQAVLEVKKEIPSISLHLIIPCRDQADRWSYINRKTYDEICASADSVRVLAEKYHRGCMHVRNRALLDASSLCICCLRAGESSGGTAYTVKEATRKGIPVINILGDNFPL